MTKIDVNKVELVWPGKYNEDGLLKELPRVNLPFQVIERVNESRATREAKKQPSQLDLFDVWHGKEGDTFEEGWRNKLIWGDNLIIMNSLLSNFNGQVDLIYIDPPFATGADFSVSAKIGEDDVDAQKKQSLIEEKIYRDTWGKGIESYLEMIYPRLVLMGELLAPTGQIYVHCDKRVNYLIRAMLNEIFGPKNLRNEVIWCYRGGGTPKKDFAEKHDTIFRYSKSEDYYFDVDPVRIPYSTASSERLEHQAKVFRGERIYTDYQPHEKGKHPEDWWTIQPIMPSERQERNITYYPTQKPVELIQRIIDSSVPPNGIVLDAFCGSGTTLVVAEGLRVLRDEKHNKSLGLSDHKRRWIGCDLSRYAIHTTRKRLLEIEGCRPFEILNLGKYERQYWQSATFAKKGEPAQHALYEYLAFILKLYRAQPLTGLKHIHGKKGKSLVHIGPVDAPVTINEISSALDECLELKQAELHILGWEWEMGLNNLMVDEAKRRGVKLLMLQIPREVMEQQAIDKDVIQFFELAYLEVDIKINELEVQITLTDFVIPNTELIPEDVRKMVDEWSDYIDYWAVDWNFQEDTFIQGWVTYRTLQDRSLTITSDKYIYDELGKYTIVVKVIDIFGNDTTQAFEVEVE